MKKNVFIFLLAFLLSIGFLFTGCDEVDPPTIIKSSDFNSLKEAFDSIIEPGTYIVEISANSNISSYTFNKKETNIFLESPGSKVTLDLTGTGSLFIVSENVTLNIGDGVVLKGSSSNDAALVTINNGGKFEMSGTAEIGYNNNTHASNFGGGVRILTGGTFLMKGGTISDNNARDGGGVYNFGTFTMSGGTIKNNTARGNISNTNDVSSGGGVCNFGKFNMTGGSINSNTARYAGGGVYIDEVGSFTKSGNSIITGINETGTGNKVVTNNEGTALTSPTAGHAVFAFRKETQIPKVRNNTAGNGINLNTATDENWAEL